MTSRQRKKRVSSANVGGDDITDLTRREPTRPEYFTKINTEQIRLMADRLFLIDFQSLVPAMKTCRTSYVSVKTTVTRCVVVMAERNLSC